MCRRGACCQISKWYFVIDKCRILGLSLKAKASTSNPEDDWISMLVPATTCSRLSRTRAIIPIVEVGEIKGMSQLIFKVTFGGGVHVQKGMVEGMT